MSRPPNDDTIASESPGAAPLRGSQAGARTHIGKYEIVALRGRGGMGVVHQAFDPVLEREVALKVMLPQIAEHPEHKQRFEREARAVARLTHPNVVTVYDLGYHTDGSPYIVMELLRGRDLFAAMQEVPPTAFEVTQAHFDELLALRVARITRPERYLLLVETGDEVLDYREAVAFYGGGFQYVRGGGDHTFTEFASQLPPILRFAGVGDTR